jgi:hypothetical protein
MRNNFYCNEHTPSYAYVYKPCQTFPLSVQNLSHTHSNVHFFTVMILSYVAFYHNYKPLIPATDAWKKSVWGVLIRTWSCLFQLAVFSIVLPYSTMALVNVICLYYSNRFYELFIFVN